MKSKIEPGSSVGILAAQSIGEISTQLTMNTKHAVGQSDMNVTLSFPRFDELLRAATKKTKSNMTICMKNRTTLANEAYIMSRGLCKCTLGMITKHSNIWTTDDEPMELPDWVHDVLWLTENVESSNIHDVHVMAELTLDPVELYKHNLTTSFVAYKLASIQATRSLYIIPSPEFRHHILLFYRAPESVKIQVKFLDKCLSKLSNLVISAVRSIRKINVTSQPSIGKRVLTEFLNKDEYVIETMGASYVELFELNSPHIDIYRTISNNVTEVWKTLGIEAARTMLIQELITIVEFGGTSIDARHIILIADTITRFGRLDPVTRDGFSKVHYDTLPLATFEKTIDQFMNAATWGQTDPGRSVSSSVILGQLMKAGTGAMSLTLDYDKLAGCYTQEDIRKKHAAPVYTIPSRSSIPDNLVKNIKESTIDYSGADIELVYNPFA